MKNEEKSSVTRYDKIKGIISQSLQNWKASMSNLFSGGKQEQEKEALILIGVIPTYAEESGEDFATELARLNLYRYGKAERLVAATHVFHMSIFERIWMLACLQAGIQEDLEGVRFTTNVRDLMKIMGAKLTLHCDTKELLEHYMKNKKIQDRETLCAQLESDFIKKHRETLERIEKRRLEEGLCPLRESKEFRRNCDTTWNATEKDELDLVTLDRKDLENFDIEAAVESKEKDGFVLKDDNALGLFLFDENCGVVAVLDQHEDVLRMRATDGTYQRYTTAIPLIETSFDQYQTSTKIDIALKYTIFSGEYNGDAARAKWKPFISQAVSEGCKLELNALLEDRQLLLTDCRTGVQMQIQPDNPDCGFESESVKEFAKRIMQAEYENILSENGISDERLHDCAMDENTLNDTEKLVLSHVDKKHEMVALRKRLESYANDADPQKIFDKKNRDKIVEQIRNDVAPEQVAHFEKLHRDYTEKLQAFERLVTTDPVLAYCRLEISQCNRIPGDENKIGVYLSDGSILSVNEQTLDEQMPVRTMKNRHLCNALSNAIEDAHQILTESRENERDFELE